MTARELQRFEHAARRALFRKELREERAAIIAGAVIFVGLPVFWTGLYSAYGSRFEVFPGIATALLLIGGWLFGAVVAAQSVCRDFGRAQGAFLLARPVLPGDVIRAKARAGFIVVGGVVLAVGVLELLLWGVARNPIDERLSWGWWLAAASASILAFWIAFAAAAITRQMLSGVMLAGLALVLMVTVPLVTTLPAAVLWRLARPPDYVQGLFLAQGVRELLAPVVLSIIALFGLLRLMLPRAYRPSYFWLVASIGLILLTAHALGSIVDQGLWLVLLLAVVGVLALVLRAVALRACRSQHALHLGTKSVAWTVGLTMMLLGTLAMTQAGANMRVTATHWDSDWDSARHGAHTGLAASSRHIAVGRAPDTLALYDIAADGQITRNLSDVGLGQWGAHRRVPFFDAQGRLFEISSWPHGVRRLDGETIAERPIRVELRQIDMAAGTVGTPQSLQLPESIPPDADTLVYDAGLANDRLFLLYGYNKLDDRHEAQIKTLAHAVLAVYDWRNGAGAPLERSFDLLDEAALDPRWLGCRLSRGVDGDLYLVSGSRCPINLTTPNLTRLDRRALAFDEDDLNWRVPLPLGAHSVAVSDRTGLFVAELSAPPKPEGLVPTLKAHVTGEVRASPWAWLFRADYPILVAAGHGRLWEVHDTSAICYDVSDPTHPRRIAHVTSYPIENAVAGPDFLLLDHRAGFSLVRNPP